MTTKSPNQTMTTQDPELDWDKPGPGTWELDGSHYEPDCARIIQRALVAGFEAGVDEGFEMIGAPLAGLKAAFVNGNFYIRKVPLIGGGRDLPPPPAPLVWLVTRIHPAFRRRAKVAEQALEARIWNDELEQWKSTNRPYLEREGGRLTAIEPATLTEDGLADHIAEVLALVDHGMTLHFRLHISDLGPIGLLLCRARSWGLDQSRVMAALAGASPATSAPMIALHEIGATARQGTSASTVFSSLDEVRAASADAQSLLDRFLAEYGHRLTTGYDVQDLTLIELPDLLLSAINNPRSDGADPDADAARAGDEALGALRAQVPEADRDELAEMVADARALYGLRDENGPLTNQWPAGLLRRAMLEAAKRLVAAGRIGDERHVFDLEADELTGLLRGGTTPAPDVLAGRMAERMHWKRQQAPAVLGPVVDDPPLWTMPGALATLMDVIVTVLDLIETRDQAPTLDGLGIGEQAMVGTARVVTDELDALARMEPGDVLIAPFTVPTYNAALATAGAVVVENGGLLCHAAVIAREFGIPGLVGVTGVTSQITDGSMVRVDAAAGTIREVSAS